MSDSDSGEEFWSNPPFVRQQSTRKRARQEQDELANLAGIGRGDIRAGISEESGSSTQLRGLSGLGRGGTLRGFGGGGRPIEAELKEILSKESPKLDEIGNCLVGLSPSEKANALKGHVQKMPRCQYPTYTQAALKNIFQDQDEWTRYEEKKGKAAEALVAFQGVIFVFYGFLNAIKYNF